MTDKSDCRMDRASDHRGIPLERGAALPHPRSRSHLWRRRYASIARHGHPGQADCAGLALAERFCRTVDRIDPPRVRGPPRSSWARRICAGSCDPMRAITMKSERTGRWTKMRRPIALFSGSGTSSHTRFSADFITITSGFRFWYTQPILREHFVVIIHLVRIFPSR